MLLIESGLVLVILLLAFLVPDAGSSVFRPIERALASLAHRRRFAVVVVGTTALGLRLAVLPILPIPYPGVHDEFSYQLMADTFAHGRLTNPTHPLWVHFENINVIHVPTYCSMYYPAQGVFLAFGQLIGGHPFWGVWLSVGLMCAAICWMLQAWVAPFWALIGGLLAAIRIGTFSYWGNSYFGGTVTAIGGALVLGALPRIKRNQRVSDALLMGLGFAILATSRPFEGLFFGAAVFAFLLIWVLRRPAETRRRSLVQIVLPLALVLAATAGFMLYYFWRTTGNPLLPAYVLDLHRYTIEPSFPWLPLRPIPHYNHDILRRYYLSYNFTMFQMARAHTVFSVIIKFVMLWFFFLGPLLSLPFLGLGFVLPYGMSLKDLAPKTRFLLIVCGATLVAVLLPVYANPHYAAAITAAIYALIMIAMQRVRHWRFRGKGAGIFLIRSTLGAAVVLLFLRAAIPVFHLSLVNSNRPETWCSPWYQLLPREEIEDRLRAQPGNHVVLVNYGKEPDPAEEFAWVNNAADIDHSQIVWAHDMGPEKNDELIRYFSGRHFWMLYLHQDSIQLLPYEIPAANAVAKKEKAAR